MDAPVGLPVSKSGPAKLGGFRAYSVMEEDEGTGGIVFAKSNAHARRLGSEQFGNGDFDWGKAVRLPWADSYFHSGRKVPAADRIAHGWHFECSLCGHRIDQDDIDEHPKRFKIVEVGERVFCNANHRNAFVLSKQHRKLIGDGCIYKMQKDLLALYPGVWLAGDPHVYVEHVKRHKWYVKECHVSFAFPGSKYGLAHYGWRDNDGKRVYGAKADITVCQGDMAAWLQFTGVKVP